MRSECCCCLVTKSCPTLLWPHGRYPARLLYPWDFPGKNTGVGCHFLSRGSSPSRDWTHISSIGRPVLYYWVTREVRVTALFHKWGNWDLERVSVPGLCGKARSQARNPSMTPQLLVMCSLSLNLFSLDWGRGVVCVLFNIFWLELLESKYRNTLLDTFHSHLCSMWSQNILELRIALKIIKTNLLVFKEEK